MNYNGSFESPRNQKVEEVLDSNLSEIANLTADSSNALNTSLANLSNDLQAIRQHLQTSGNNQNSHIYSEIQQLRQSLADLSQEIHRRNY